MPRMNGLEVCRTIREEKLPTQLILLTVAINEEEMAEAVYLGIRGIVLKEMAPQFIVQCIRKVHAGEQWVERQSTRRTLEKMLRREAGGREVVGSSHVPGNRARPPGSQRSAQQGCC